MFGWLKGKPIRRLYPGSPTLGKDALAIVAEYGAILERLDGMSICDASQLPQSKDDMKLALKAAWRLTSDENLRDAVEVAFVSLSRFRDGIGPTPLRFILPDPTNITKEHLAAGEVYLKLSKQVQDEMGQLSAELDVFTARQKTAKQTRPPTTG
jgi:hypothetical protein